MLCMILKTRGFQRWAKRVGLSDEALSLAVSEMAEGLFDADLGGGVVKKRVALPGQGKRGSTRTLLATNRNDRWIFIFGFEKNKRANISSKELAALRLLAEDLLALDSVQLAKAIDSGALLEVTDEKKPNAQ
ncbi:MAG: type II toxin-antitoxin system RelE/ParE family toxin [Deltaproteobacteria bacterium]|nr:MAG: type II toxin-antitoxin system RelE/ParE family toxin [Deltaproteobacteria bacterium]